MGQLDQGSATELRRILGATGLEGDHIYRAVLSENSRRSVCGTGRILSVSRDPDLDPRVWGGNGTVVHHALQDWGLICFTIAEYWTKSIVQSLLGIIGDLTFFLINSARCFGNLIKA